MAGLKGDDGGLEVEGFGVLRALDVRAPFEATLGGEFGQ